MSDTVSPQTRDLDPHLQHLVSSKDIHIMVLLHQALVFFEDAPFLDHQLLVLCLVDLMLLHHHRDII